MTFTAADLDKAIDNIEQEVIEEKTGHYSLWEYLSTGEPFEHDLEGIGTLKDNDHGGAFHDGGTIYAIISVGDRLFRKEGRYSSWDSSYWDGNLEEVEQFERTVTDYRTI